MGENNKAGETRQEIILEWIYLEKRQFVKKLEESLLCLDDIRGVEYRASNEVFSDEGYSHDGCIEWVRIDWHGARDPHIYIDVTANSLRQILDQVVSMVLHGRPDFRIRNTEREGEHWADKLWDKLGEVKIYDPIYEENGEDHYGKLPSDAASVMQEVRKRYDELEGEGSYEKGLKEFVEKHR